MDQKGVRCFHAAPNAVVSLLDVSSPQWLPPNRRKWLPLKPALTRRYFGFIGNGPSEAAFELHAGLPHTIRFLEAAERLLTHSIQGLRSREITIENDE